MATVSNLSKREADVSLRLAKVESRLRIMGMRDVKFTFGENAPAMSPAELAADVADVLEKFHAGHREVVDKLPSEELTQSQVSAETMLKVKEDAAKMLEAYADGKCKPLPSFGDASERR